MFRRSAFSACPFIGFVLWWSRRTGNSVFIESDLIHEPRSLLLSDACEEFQLMVIHLSYCTVNNRGFVKCSKKSSMSQSLRSWNCVFVIDPRQRAPSVGKVRGLSRNPQYFSISIMSTIDDSWLQAYKRSVVS
jgi:hypothetical protein